MLLAGAMSLSACTTLLWLLLSLSPCLTCCPSSLCGVFVKQDTEGLSFGKPERKLGWNAQPTTTVVSEHTVLLGQTAAELAATDWAGGAGRARLCHFGIDHSHSQPGRQPHDLRLSLGEHLRLPLLQMMDNVRVPADSRVGQVGARDGSVLSYYEQQGSGLCRQLAHLHLMCSPNAAWGVSAARSEFHSV